MWIVAALYQFTPFPDPAALQNGLTKAAEVQSVVGTLLLAPEGINGTIAGSRSGIDALLGYIQKLPGCQNLT